MSIVVQPVVFQSHPAYRAQTDLLKRLPGCEIRPLIPRNDVEHERWREGETRLARWCRRRRLSRQLQCAGEAGSQFFVTGPFPPSMHWLTESNRIHVDADDPLSLFPAGGRNRLPATHFRKVGIEMLAALRVGRLTLSFWSQVQLLSFLANFRAEEMLALLDAGRVGVLPPAISPRRELSRVGADSRLRCLTIASGKFWLKGVPDAIAVVDGLFRLGRQVALTIVADHVPPEWRAFVSHHPMMALHERLSRAELEQLFGVHDLLLFPTHHDTYGWTVLEAKSHGLPTVTTDFYSRPEIVTHGRDGLLVVDPFASPYLPVGPVQYAEAHLLLNRSGMLGVGPALQNYVDALSGAIAQLDDDRGLLRRMGQAALADTLPGGRFSGERRLKQTAGWLEK